MAKTVQNFEATAVQLSGSPLGIIALFIVLVYGFASLVTAFSGSLSANEKVPLIYFLIIFPIFVLGVFAWLVSQHANKLYPPNAYKDETNFVTVIASLAAASAKQPSSLHSQIDIERISSAVRKIRPQSIISAREARKRILWVDDRPDNNIYERKAFEGVGILCTISLSTNDALRILDSENFDAIISDMGRKEGDREGYVLLEAVRKRNLMTPFFIYAGSNLPQHLQEAISCGAQGSTNDAQDLFIMVTKAILSGSNVAA